jgi:AraC-like DNA-binding protein
MKIQFEKLKTENNNTFSVLVNPRMNDFFFWHFHPEYELVYIENASATRHIGEHISRFEGSDLVFIGSNIPHLNFDYGVKTHYEKIVIHVHPDFFDKAILFIPELLKVKELFEQSKFAIAFGETAKNSVGERMKNLDKLEPFNQFLEILSLFQLLSDANDKTFLHDKPVENRYNKKEQERLKSIYTFIDTHYQRKIDIEEVAALSHLSVSAFCRLFKKITLITFTEFLNHYRINQAKKLLLIGKNVSETCFDCGFESVSYFDRIFKKVTGENPLAFKNRYQV